MAIVSIASLRCAGPDIAGGGTIETTNGIAGVICNIDNTPLPNAVVRLFPDDYDPVANSVGVLDTIFTDTTDTSGSYHFQHVISGRYVVLARNNSAATALVIWDISVDGDSVTTVPAATMNRTGAIAAGFSSEGASTEGYLYIPGTDIYSRINSDGLAQLVDVPPGTLQTVILASGDDEKRNILRDKIIITAGDTVIIELPLWKYCCRLGLNTTPSGADVAGDVTRFPVLVRLKSGNFDFSQAGNDGEDLVFIGKDGRRFPYQIEQVGRCCGACRNMGEGRHYPWQ